MGEVCYTCDHVIRQYNEITGQYLYFCKALCKSVLANWSCGLFKHEALSPEEEELQKLIDEKTDVIFQQLGISRDIIEDHQTATQISIEQEYKRLRHFFDEED